DVYNVALTNIVLSPDMLDQIIAAEHLAGVLRQLEQQLHLVRRQPGDTPIGQPHLQRGDVDLQLARADRLAGAKAPPPIAAQDRIDAGSQLGGLEGLADVVVRPHAQALYTVLQLTLGRDEDHRQVVILIKKALVDLEAVELREINVEQHEVRWLAFDQS